jgi:hypothetical protein
MFGGRISMQVVNRRILIFMGAIWLACLGIILIPGGVITQIWEADERFNERLAASPLGKLCYNCSAPAVYRAEYSDGSIRYYCEQHIPPKRTRRESPGDKGSKGFNPQFCIITLLIFYGVNALRAMVHIFRPWRAYIPTLPGALIGLVAAMTAWWWFHSLKR